MREGDSSYHVCACWGVWGKPTPPAWKIIWRITSSPVQWYFFTLYQINQIITQSIERCVAQIRQLMSTLRFTVLVRRDKQRTAFYHANRRRQHMSAVKKKNIDIQVRQVYSYTGNSSFGHLDTAQRSKISLVSFHSDEHLVFTLNKLSVGPHLGSQRHPQTWSRFRLLPKNGNSLRSPVGGWIGYSSNCPLGTSINHYFLETA